MAIEQRIGRIDRIGQSREVFVFNLVTRGTLEEQVLATAGRKDLRCSSWSSARSAPSSAAWRRSASSPIWCWTPGWRPPRPRRAAGLRCARPAARPGAPAARGRQGARREAVRRGFRDGVRADAWEPCAISSPTCWRARARSSSRWSRTGSKCWRPSRLRAAMGWPELARLGFGAELPAGAMPVGLEGDWLDRFGALLGERGRCAERQLVAAARRRAGDPERLLDRHSIFPTRSGACMTPAGLDALPAARLPLHRHVRREARGAGLARLQRRRPARPSTTIVRRACVMLLAGEVRLAAPDRRCAPRGRAWPGTRPTLDGADPAAARSAGPARSGALPARHAAAPRPRPRPGPRVSRRSAPDAHDSKLAALAAATGEKAEADRRARDLAGRGHRARICRQARRSAPQLRVAGDGRLGAGPRALRARCSATRC